MGGRGRRQGPRPTIKGVSRAKESCNKAQQGKKVNSKSRGVDKNGRNKRENSREDAIMTLAIIGPGGTEKKGGGGVYKSNLETRRGCLQV